MEFIKFRITDAIDIILVMGGIYYFLSFIRGTKAIQMILGLLSVLVLGIAADFLKFETLSFIAKGFGAVWIIIFVILFQPELRNAFARIGRTRIGRLFNTETKDVMDELIKSAILLSDMKHGGIIVIERDIACKNYIDTGHKIEAKVSSELIATIFNPTSPLHDGAIIVKGDLIIASSCILPLSERIVNPSIGTRHRAALGLVEETDAICIVISEETGNISIAAHRELMTNILRDKLKTELTKELL
ncbi:MAG: TIGR00159 family protein [Candidatus Stahlbacteria bacterium]|nr:TIGR00159 family protein [Candidatus Stahlbacteria bacterium]